MKSKARHSIPPSPEHLDTAELRQTLWKAAMDSAEFPMIMDSSTKIWIDRAAKEYKRRIEENVSATSVAWPLITENTDDDVEAEPVTLH